MSTYEPPNLNLREIHEEMQSEVYGSHVDMGHCSAHHFMTWYLHFKDALVHPGTPPDMHLRGFDVESVVGIMAEWIKAPFSEDTLP